MEYKITTCEKYILITTSGPADVDVYEESLEAIFYTSGLANHASVYY
jgi:hypothetical protein